MFYFSDKVNIKTNHSVSNKTKSNIKKVIKIMNDFNSNKTTNAVDKNENDDNSEQILLIKGFDE